MFKDSKNNVDTCFECFLGMHFRAKTQASNLTESSIPDKSAHPPVSEPCVPSLPADQTGDSLGPP
jgi:hypothetical protein